MITWHEMILLISSMTSLVGLGWWLKCASTDVTEAEALQDTLVRMTFVYWLLHCGAIAAERYGPLAWSVDMNLRLLIVLSFILTFCCVISIPLHALEQRQTRPQ